MGSNPRVIAVDLWFVWDHMPQRLTRGQVIDVVPGSALEAAIGPDRLSPLAATAAQPAEVTPGDPAAAPSPLQATGVSNQTPVPAADVAQVEEAPEPAPEPDRPPPALPDAAPDPHEADPALTPGLGSGLSNATLPRVTERAPAAPPGEPSPPVRQKAKPAPRKPRRPATAPAPENQNP